MGRAKCGPGRARADFFLKRAEAGRAEQFYVLSNPGRIIKIFKDAGRIQFKDVF